MARFVAERAVEAIADLQVNGGASGTIQDGSGGKCFRAGARTGVTRGICCARVLAIFKSDVASASGYMNGHLHLSESKVLAPAFPVLLSNGTTGKWRIIDNLTLQVWRRATGTGTCNIL